MDGGALAPGLANLPNCPTPGYHGEALVALLARIEVGPARCPDLDCFRVAAVRAVDVCCAHHCLLDHACLPRAPSQGRRPISSGARRRRGYQHGQGRVTPAKRLRVGDARPAFGSVNPSVTPEAGSGVAIGGVGVCDRHAGFRAGLQSSLIRWSCVRPGCDAGLTQSVALLGGAPRWGSGR